MANLPLQSDMKSLPYAFAMNIPQNIEKSILPDHMTRLYEINILCLFKELNEIKEKKKHLRRLPCLHKYWH